MIDRPVRRIIKTARKWESGDTSAAFPKFRYSDEFGQLSAALTRMSGRIDELLKQKDLLLRELQHRVMNSLALLSSLLEMQRRSTKSSVAKENLANARGRVVAMGTAYRHLYQTDALEYVEFSDFLRTICGIEGKSSSLGMKIVASTVRQFGGALEINRLKPGTEFVIHLPANIARS